MTGRVVVPSPFELPADQPWSARVLFRTEVGSTAHGTGLPGREDYDEIAVVSESIESLAGLVPDKDTIVWRPGRAPTDRSGPGDWDLVVYTARKWARLAAQGNPSILVSIFGPLRQASVPGLHVLENVEWFWSDLARRRFLGYARAQRERLLGIRGGRHTNRPELVAELGFDTKYAMHMLRLGFQGVEFIQTGALRLPMDGERGEYLLAVRRGEVSLEDCLDRADDLERQLERLDGVARPTADVAAINGWLVGLARTAAA